MVVAAADTTDANRKTATVAAKSFLILPLPF